MPYVARTDKFNRSYYRYVPPKDAGQDPEPGDQATEVLPVILKRN